MTAGKYSIDLSCRVMQGRFSSMRTVRFQNPCLVFLRLPKIKDKSIEYEWGNFPAYLTHQTDFELKWRSLFGSIADSSTDNMSYDELRQQTLQPLFDLVQDTEHMRGSAFRPEYESARILLLLDPITRATILKISSLNHQSGSMYRIGNELVVFSARGRTIQSLIAEESSITLSK